MGSISDTNDYISRSEALKAISEYQGGAVNKVVAKELLEAMPHADVVSRTLFEQIKWERDIAIQQLEDEGLQFCGERRTDG